MLFRLLASLAVAALCLLAGCQRARVGLAPEDALKTLVIDPGFRVELFAAEPLISSPVAMDVDEDGRIYVVENPGYPLNVEGRVGKVKLLEDTNGDGRPDRSVVFADGLVMPTGVMRWKRGVLVTDAPHVLYYEDANGDGRADIRKIVLTGFPFTNPQHTVNSPLFGLDNWIYLAHEPPAHPIIYKEKFGDTGGDIQFADRPETRIMEKGRNIRFRPDTLQIEALSGRSQFGIAFDEAGNLFSVHNEMHALHEALAARYIRRNPDVPISDALAHISDHGDAAEVFPIVARPPVEMLSGVGSFTSACGITVYHGGEFPEGYEGSHFVAEPVHSLVHRDIVEPAGATFVARRPPGQREFLASSDPLFRPVNLYVGPDGAMYVLDYYRPRIEHPEWMSSHMHKHAEELSIGNELGRIYRVVPQAGLPSFSGRVRLGQASDEELVRQLGTPNLWWRRTAQRLLLDRKPSTVAPLLAHFFQETGSAVGRLHALWALEGHGKLGVDLLEKALNDKSPAVRRNALIIAEPRLLDGSTGARPRLGAEAARLAPRVLALERDTDGAVRYQALLTLGYLKTDAARQARQRLLAANIEDRWAQLAALTASPDDWMHLFDLASGRGGRAPVASLAQQAAALIGARRPENEVDAVIRAVTAVAGRYEDWRAATLQGLASGLRMRGDKEARRPWGTPVLRLFATDSGQVRKAVLRILAVTGLPAGTEAIIARAMETGAESSADPELRADSIGLVALADPAIHRPGLERLLDPGEPEPVRVAAVRALGRIKGIEPARHLLSEWRTFTPAVRGEALDALLLEQERIPLLLEAMKKHEVQPWTFAFRHRRRLVMYSDDTIRNEARAIFDQAAAEREQLLKNYEPALATAGDPARGKAVFEQNCSKCHRMNGSGAEVGPALDTVRNQPKSELLRHILLPSASIAQNYESYVIETASGRMVDGVLGAQTPASVTVRQEGGQAEVIPRSQIRGMHVSDVSAMPDGLEKQIDIRAMADLLEYLKR